MIPSRGNIRGEYYIAICNIAHKIVICIYIGILTCSHRGGVQRFVTDFDIETAGDDNLQAYVYIIGTTTMIAYD